MSLSILVKAAALLQHQVSDESKLGPHWRDCLTLVGLPFESLPRRWESTTGSSMDWRLRGNDGDFYEQKSKLGAVQLG